MPGRPRVGDDDVRSAGEHEVGSSRTAATSSGSAVRRSIRRPAGAAQAQRGEGGEPHAPPQAIRCCPPLWHLSSSWLGVPEARSWLVACWMSSAPELVVIANTGDDVEIYGAHVSPDPDLITFWLAD